MAERTIAPKTRDGLGSMPQLLDRTLTKLEEDYERASSITGVPTGIHGVDEILCGLQPGSLVVVGGRPGVGKTSLVLGIALHIALEVRRPAIYVSLESTESEVMQAALASEARVHLSRLRSGRLSETDWTKISHAIGRMAESPFYLSDDPSTDSRAVADLVEEAHGTLGDLGVVVIDGFQLLSDVTGADEGRNDDALRTLKRLAHRFQVPVLLTAQVSRAVERRADKRPLLMDLRGAESMEEDSDVVILVYRDEIYRYDSPDRGTAELLVAKHRGGPTGMDRVAFLDHYKRFANMARPAPDEPEIGSHTGK